ncbi:MAG: tripartite tricarboxylate transporter TctB family protein [Xanthobacteraceae bacterium]
MPVVEPQQRRIDPAGIAAAVLLLALAGVIVWDMTTLRITATYGPGPKAMPSVVATGLVLVAAGNLYLAFRGEWPEREQAAWTPVLLILGGLLAVIVLIAIGGGFIPATAILFAATATGFGRRAVLTDLAIGLALATTAYLVFAKILTLSLPMGPIERLL